MNIPEKPLRILPRALLPVLLSFTAARAQVVRIQQTEACDITCAAGPQPEGSPWAANGQVTPAFWGREPGDAVEWRLRLPEPERRPHLAVRYSYARDAYVGFSHAENTSRTLACSIDGTLLEPLHVPDTGNWHVFATTRLDLPALEPGDHTFRIWSTAPHSTTNLDCFILYNGEPDVLPPSLAHTILATSPSNHFQIRATAGVRLRAEPGAVFSQFERIYDAYRSTMGWEPPNPVVINVLEDARWDNPGATAYQNNAGVFFKESTFLTDTGNWVHEMTHMFYVAHFPGWFDEPSARVLTTCLWVPGLFPRYANPQQDPAFREALRIGREVLARPTTYHDSIEPILYAIWVKYGPDVFRRFFHQCAEAGRAGHIDFTPGRHLTRDEIVRYFSIAAGEDLTPLFQRWTGYSTAP